MTGENCRHNFSIRIDGMDSDRLRLMYPKTLLEPMLYRVEDDRIYLILDV